MVSFKGGIGKASSLNPFAHPLTLRRFYVRRPGLEAQLEALLLDGQSVLLVGPEDVGKSALLRQLHRRYAASQVLRPHVQLVNLELNPVLTPLTLVPHLQRRLKRVIDRNGLDWGSVPWIQGFSDDRPEMLSALARLFEAMEEEGLELIFDVDPLADLHSSMQDFWVWLEPWLGRATRLVGAVRQEPDIPAPLRSHVQLLQVDGLEEAEQLELLTAPFSPGAVGFTADEIAALGREALGRPGSMLKLAGPRYALKLEADAGDAGTLESSSGTTEGSP